MARRVYAVADSGHDLSKSAEFGELIFLFGRDEKVNVFAADLLQRTIAEKLVEAESDDFLILTGNALANCVAYTYFVKSFGKCNVLIYSFRDERYELRTVRDVDFQFEPDGNR